VNPASLNVIKSLYDELASGRQEYDFLPPALVSHADHYASQPERLRTYARQVISARIMILLVSSRMNTQALLNTYLLGVASSNPFPMVLAARSQLELYAVVADTTAVIDKNAGEHPHNFSARVRAVDEALINATFASRSSQVKELMTKAVKSKARPVNPTDHEVLISKNVLTRLDKLARSGVYSECKNDYERLCEYVHPNYGMNTLHVVASPLNDKLLRFSLKSQEPFERSLSASVDVMARAAQETVAAIDKIQPPFGAGVTSNL
jgi:hypothetical protein